MAKKVKKKRSRKPKRRRGAGKGQSFERKICKALSRWVTGGRHEDVFWRTAISGGRATVQARRGVRVRQSGDICAVAPEGLALTNKYYFELKHYKRLDFGRFLLKQTGPLEKFWKKTVWLATAEGKQPLMIVRENGMPIVVLTRFSLDCKIIAQRMGHDPCYIVLFETWMATVYRTKAHGNRHPTRVDSKADTTATGRAPARTART